jgi:hypothetical protein
MFRLLAQVLLSFLTGFWPLTVPKYEKKNRFEDPVYKRNVRELIERNKRFEGAKE